VVHIAVRVTSKTDYGLEVPAGKMEEAIHNHNFGALLALQ